MLLASVDTTTVSGVGSVGGDSASVSPTAESVELASPTVSVPSVGLLRRGKGSVSVTGSEAAVRGETCFLYKYSFLMSLVLYTRLRCHPPHPLHAPVGAARDRQCSGHLC